MKDRDRDWALVGVSLVVAVLVLPMVCSDEPSPPGTVLLVGDSLLWQSLPAVDQALRADGWEPQVAAVPGAGITGGGSPHVEWRTRLHELVGQHDPEIVVIELGTNGCGPGCPGIPQAIDAVMNEVRDVPEVLWLDARTEAPRPPERVEIAQALQDSEERWDNLTVLSFDQWFRGHPEYLDVDAVHLSDQGELVLARRLQGAIREHADVPVQDAADDR
jgi:lysophospholipase L1-like esterase